MGKLIQISDVSLNISIHPETIDISSGQNTGMVNLGFLSTKNWKLKIYLGTQK